jgi:hypothetical protein
MHDEVEMLAARLDALERANRRLRRALVAVGAGAVLLGALASTRTAVAKDPKVIDCQKVRIVDSTDKVRGVFGLSNDETPVFALIDAEGKARTVVTLDAEGNPSLAFTDKTEKPRLSMAHTDSGPAVVLRHKDEGACLSLASAPGETGIVIQDADNKARLSSVLNKDNVTLLVFKDGAEKPRAYIGTDSDGKPEMKLLDEKGGDIWKKP